MTQQPGTSPENMNLVNSSFKIGRFEIIENIDKRSTEREKRSLMINDSNCSKVCAKSNVLSINSIKGMNFLPSRNINCWDSQSNNTAPVDIKERSSNFDFQTLEEINIGGKEFHNREIIKKGEKKEEHQKIDLINKKFDFNNKLDVLDKNNVCQDQLEFGKINFNLPIGDETTCSKNKPILKEKNLYNLNNMDNLENCQLNLNKQGLVKTKNTFSFGIPLDGLENLQMRTCPKQNQCDHEVVHIHLNNPDKNEKSDLLKEKSMTSLKVNVVPKLNLKKLKESNDLNQYQNHKPNKINIINNINNINNQKISASNNLYPKTLANTNKEQNIKNQIQDLNYQFPKDRKSDLYQAKKRNSHFKNKKNKDLPKLSNSESIEKEESNKFINKGSINKRKEEKSKVQKLHNIEIKEQKHLYKKNKKKKFKEYEGFQKEYLKPLNTLNTFLEGSSLSDSSSFSDNNSIEIDEYKAIKSKIKHISNEIMSLKYTIKHQEQKELKYLNNLNSKKIAKKNRIIAQVIDDQCVLSFEIKSLRNQINKFKVCNKRM